MIPSNQVTFQDADFLALANDEMNMALVPLVLQFHEDFFLESETQTIVAMQDNYKVPYRAIGNKLRSLMFVDTNNNFFEMSRIMVEDLPYFASTFTSNQFKHYYFQNNEIRLAPSPGSSVSGSLKFFYYIRPSQLVSTSRVAVITAINTTTGDITVDGVPTEENSTTSLFSTADLFDFVQIKSPHRILSMDVTATAVNTTTNTITFDPDDLPSTLAVGDRICLAEETDVPQLPDDLHNILAERVAARCLEALGDAAGLQAANQKIAELEVKTGMVIDNRSEGEPVKVVNRHGPLRIATARKRWWNRF